MTIFGLDLNIIFLQIDINLLYNLFVIILAIILIIQTFELLHLSPFFIKNQINKKNANLIWDYNNIKKQYSNFSESIRKSIDFFLIDNHFKKLLFANIFLLLILILNHIIAILPINFIIIIFLIFIQLLISNRFGGSFNGASDSMVLMILISALFFELDELANLFNISIDNNVNQKLSFIYLTFNVSNSYFSAGLVKIKEKNWLNGIALRIFFEESIIDSSFKNKILKLLEVKLLSRFVSIFIILWEISILVMVFMPNYFIIYLIFGLLFHFLNFLLFGLNRFFLLWVITYPILLYTSIHYLSTIGLCML